MLFLVNEYDSPKELARRLEELEKYSHYPRKVIETIAENSGCTLTIFHLDDSETMSNDEKIRLCFSK